MLSQAGFPTTMVIILAIVTANIFMMCFLSEPGAYLPKEQHKVSESVASLARLDIASTVINDSVKYPLIGGTSLSFEKTFHELTHGVIRPRLNETSIDLDVFGAASSSNLNDLETSQ